MTELEEKFFGLVYELTSKRVGIDYGYVVGTHHPLGLSKGMVSASRQEGYTIWKKVGEEIIEKQITERKDLLDSLRTTVNFLNDTNFKIKLTKNQ